MKATALSENMKSMAVELDYVRSQNEKLGRENVYYKQKLGGSPRSDEYDNKYMQSNISQMSINQRALDNSIQQPNVYKRKQEVSPV